MESRRIRVLCVDDSLDLGQAFRMLLSRDVRFEHVGSRASADGILEEVERSKPDVVLMDLTMAGMPPLQAIRLLADRAPWCRAIAYSGYDDRETEQAALRAGAWAFVSKLVDPVEMLAEIHRVATQPSERQCAVATYGTASEQVGPVTRQSRRTPWQTAWPSRG